jgi:hypothetical protein
VGPETNNTPPPSADVVHVIVDPGICGLPCAISARKSDNKTVIVAITESECKQIQRLSNHLTEISLRELFLPMTRNPVYIAAEKSGCHPSCAVPVAILKAVEVAWGVALPKNVQIIFRQESSAKGNRGTD